MATINIDRRDLIFIALASKRTVGFRPTRRCARSEVDRSSRINQALPNQTSYETRSRRWRPRLLYPLLHKHLLRNHSDRPQPRLHQLRPAGYRKLSAPQPEGMPALRIQMHLHRNPGLLQRNIIDQRVVYIVHGVILRLQQKRRRRLAGDGDIRIQLKTFLSAIHRCPG